MDDFLTSLVFKYMPIKSVNHRSVLSLALDIDVYEFALNKI